MRLRLTARWLLTGSVLALIALGPPVHAATISWKGHTWNVTGGGMAGVCPGNAANVFVDASDYLHMKISNNGGTWTAAELFSTDKIGFGTYQWQIEGPTDRLDRNVVLGLYPYGPAAGMGQSGNNEIDIEFTRWGNNAWPNGNYTIWPPTGSTSASHTFTFSLAGGTSLTTRFTWSSTQIDFATLSGFVAVEAQSSLIDAWTFAPANPATRITQAAMPLGMNLWCYQNPPSDGQNVEIIIRDFQFVPLGTAVDGGADGSGATGGASGKDDAGADGATGRDGPREGGGATKAGTGGAISSGASGGATGAGTGGAMSSGTSSGATGDTSGNAGGTSGSAGGTSGGAGGTSGGAGGTTSSGGAPNNLGTGGTVAASGGSGVVASSGSGNAGGGPAGTSSSGCSCAVTSSRSALGGPLLALALLLARRHRRRRA